MDAEPSQEKTRRHAPVRYGAQQRAEKRERRAEDAREERARAGSRRVTSPRDGIICLSGRASGESEALGARIFIGGSRDRQLNASL